MQQLGRRCPSAASVVPEVVNDKLFSFVRLGGGCKHVILIIYSYNSSPCRNPFCSFFVPPSSSLQLLVCGREVS